MNVPDLSLLKQVADEEPKMTEEEILEGAKKVTALEVYCLVTALLATLQQQMPGIADVVVAIAESIHEELGGTDVES